MAGLDAIALLKADHRNVEELFERFENTSGKTARQKIAKQICLELVIHTMIEEEIFYPAIADGVEENIVREAHVEHDGAKMLIAEILASDGADPFYDAKVKVLSEEIKHHVKEEEQRNGMFAQAKRMGADLEALGEQLAMRKTELMRQFKANGVPTPETRSLRGAKLKFGQPVAFAP